MKIIIDVTDELLEKLKPAIENGEQICQWIFDSDYDESEYYATDCGNRYKEYFAAGPQDANFRFCPFCGAKISSLWSQEKEMR